MVQQQTKPVVDKVDPVWARICREAEEIVRREPELATFLYSTILHHDTLEGAIVYRLSERLDHPALSGELIRQAYSDALKDTPSIGESFRVDIAATVDRDPATHRLIEPVLYYKGFHAIQTHRLMHWLWRKGRRDFALYLQSRASAVFQCDIHPAAKVGRGIFVDHATGLVVGETAVIEDDVSMLHDVTLGGTGKQWEDRHPKIRYGVMIGAGAEIFSAISRSGTARVLPRVPSCSSRCRTTSPSPAFRPRSWASPAVRSPRGSWIKCSTTRFDRRRRRVLSSSML